MRAERRPAWQAGATSSSPLGDPLRLLPEPSDERVEDVYAGLVLSAPEPGSDRATISLDMVSSIDGATALRGLSRGLGGTADTIAFGRLRAACDAIVVGAGTVRIEDYGPATGDAARRAERVDAGLAPVPTVIVVTSRAALDPDARLFRAPRGVDPADVPRVVVATHRRAPADRLAALAEVADVVTFGDEEVDLGELARWCHARGLTRVLCEGGPTLNGSLAVADLIDEVFVTLAPLLVAGEARRLVDGPELPEPTRFELAEARAHDSELLLRYRTVR